MNFQVCFSAVLRRTEGSLLVVCRESSFELTWMNWWSGCDLRRHGTELSLAWAAAGSSRSRGLNVRLFGCAGKRKQLQMLTCGCLKGNSSKQGKQVLDRRWVSLRSLLQMFSMCSAFRQAKPLLEHLRLYPRMCSKCSTSDTKAWLVLKDLFHVCTEIFHPNHKRTTAETQSQTLNTNYYWQF